MTSLLWSFLTFQCSHWTYHLFFICRMVFKRKHPNNHTIPYEQDLVTLGRKNVLLTGKNLQLNRIREGRWSVWPGEREHGEAGLNIKITIWQKFVFTGSSGTLNTKPLTVASQQTMIPCVQAFGNCGTEKLPFFSRKMVSDAPAGKQSAAGGLISLKRRRLLSHKRQAVWMWWLEQEDVEVWKWYHRCLSSAEGSFLDSGVQKNLKKSSRLQRLRWPD